MLPLVELPEIVRHYAPWFESGRSPQKLYHLRLCLL